MVITDEFSNNTMLIQLRCLINRRNKGTHVEQKKNPTVEITIQLLFNISQKKEKKKITYSKYKTNSKLKLQGWCTGKFFTT